MSDRDDQKARYKAYVDVARNTSLQVYGVSVPAHPTVQEVEDGAYVEAIIWVPRRTIDAAPK